MLSNPTLKRLGLSNAERVVIIHTDDIGMCQDSVSAYSALHESGLKISGSTMVPCSWFPAAAAYCRAHPDADMGVHITLTCEWNAYRWGPLSTRDAASGLLDAEGYLPRGNTDVHANLNPAAATSEMHAQVERALAAGIRITHIDTHMGTVIHPLLIDAYLDLGARYHVPVMFPRMGEEEALRWLPDAEQAQRIMRRLAEWETNGVPMIDHIGGMPLDIGGDHADHVAVARRAFAALQPGITHFILHPSTDTPELRAIAPDWPARVENLRAFLHTDLRDELQRMGVHISGYRDLM